MLPLSLFTMSRQRWFYHAFMYTTYMSSMAFFKVAYADPRPYMISDTIKPLSCSSEFGNPSGHSEASILVGLGVFLDVFHGVPDDHKVV